ncbi:hypothetical protein BC477_07210 [Clavibacter michiganensis subsp. michiganensis]|uniref:Uncharacterized protein n=1 Tax=Clavibacter michiganensis subsp. michiganensis TaxID=33013 RepID=A0A251XM50_CLAMM|nr:hypothetical protein BC477_07210 [Clavibacter michiganensis subsp. michiganensis]OUE04506.1 hypothetical protein CMMCAS07_06140 [Clavibacter michiganensis subsp. michiganensis]
MGVIGTVAEVVREGMPYRDEQYRTGVAARGAKRAAKSVSFGRQAPRRSDS